MHRRSAVRHKENSPHQSDSEIEEQPAWPDRVRSVIDCSRSERFSKEHDNRGRVTSFLCIFGVCEKHNDPRPL